MKNLSDLRKELKSIGFGVRTKTMYIGRVATYYHIATGKKLCFNVFSTSQLEFWGPLFKFQRDNVEDIKKIEVIEKIKCLLS